MREKISGVYCIENVVNGKKYIGSSKDLNYRMANHRWDLNKGKHFNYHLQNSWNFYGCENFEFKIIETCAENQRLEREQHWINHYITYDYNNGYNKAKLTQCPNKLSKEETILKLKQGFYKINFEVFEKIVFYLKDTNIPIPEIGKILKTKPYYIYSIYYRDCFSVLTENVNFIYRKPYKLCETDVAMIIERLKNKEYCRDIALDYNVNQTTISSIRDRKIHKDITNGMYFPLLKRRSEQPTLEKPVEQYTTNGEYIATYQSAHHAIRALGGKGANNISMACCGKVITAKNYIWFYGGDMTQDEMDKRIYLYNQRLTTSKKKVYCKTTNRYFNSVRQASIEYDIKRNTMSENLRKFKTYTSQNNNLNRELLFIYG